MNNKFEDKTSGIGTTSNNDIIEKLFSSHHDDIIKENLKDITKTFFPLPEIEKSAEKNIYYEKDDKTPISQYHIEIGSTEQHQSHNLFIKQKNRSILIEKKNQSILSMFDDNYKTFIEQIKQFYVSLFSVGEEKSITSALNSPFLFHVVIYCNYYVRSRNDDNIKLYMEKEIVASATFRIARSSSMLVYFGCSHEGIIENDNIKLRSKKDNRIEDTDRIILVLFVYV